MVQLPEQLWQLFLRKLLEEAEFSKAAVELVEALWAVSIGQPRSHEVKSE